MKSNIFNYINFILVRIADSFGWLNMTSQNSINLYYYNFFNKSLQELLHNVQIKKFDAINRYKNESKYLVNEIEKTVYLSKMSLRIKFLEEFNKINLTKFGKKEKIDNLEKKSTLILEEELVNFYNKIENLMSRFYHLEENLDNDLKSILLNLFNNCQKLRVSTSNSNVDKAKKSNRLAIGDIIADYSAAHGVSNAVAHGVSNAVAHVATHGVSNAAAHEVSNAAAHEVSNAAAHFAIQGSALRVSYAVGFAIPVLNLPTMFSFWKSENFSFSDDLQLKREIQNHTHNEIDKVYRLMMYGDESNIGLKEQLQYLKDELIKQKVTLFHDALQGILNSIMKRS